MQKKKEMRKMQKQKERSHLLTKENMLYPRLKFKPCG